MSRALLFLLLLSVPRLLRSQTLGAPDECYGFTFGAWNPSLKSVANTYNPGYDPTSSAPAGAPRDWASRVPNGSGASAAADSVLLLFPGWWPAGVAIEWRERRGDTLVGLARALVADGRVKNPEAAVRGTRVPCRRPGASPRDTSSMPRS